MSRLIDLADDRYASAEDRSGQRHRHPALWIAIALVTLLLVGLALWGGALLAERLEGPRGPRGAAGVPGSVGPTGQPGSPGPAGSGGGAIALGQGVVSIGACDPEVGLRLTSVYDFDRNTFWLATLSLLRVARSCEGMRLSLGLYSDSGRLLATTSSPVLLRSGGLPEFFVTVLSSQLSARVDARAVRRVTIEIA